MSQGKKAVKTVGFMVLATLAAKVLGLLREVFFAQQFGSSAEATAYFNASRIPILFFDLTLGAAILSTFIPVFNRYLEKSGKEEAERFAGRFLQVVVGISVIFCLVGIVGRSLLIDVIAPGLAPEVKALSQNLLILLLPTTLFTAAAYVFVGILQSYDEFNIPAIISLVSNLAVILYLLFFSDRFGIYGMAAAMLAGWSLQVLIQLPALRKKGFRYRPVRPLIDDGIKEVFRLALPILISSWLQPVCVAVNLRLASYLTDSVQVISGLEYANRLYVILVGVFTFAITNYIFPAMSRMSEGGKEEAFADTARTSLRAMFLLIFPIMAGMMLLSEEIITIVYQRGEFSAESTMYTSTALFFYCIGMVAYGFNEIANKTFFARKQVRPPMLASICGIIVTAVGGFIGTRILDGGIVALAASASLGTLSAAVLMGILLHRSVPGIFNRKLFLSIFRIAAATLIMSAAVLLVRGFLDGLWMRTILCALVGVVVYAVLILLMKEVRYGALKK